MATDAGRIVGFASRSDALDRLREHFRYGVIEELSGDPFDDRFGRSSRTQRQDRLPIHHTLHGREAEIPAVTDHDGAAARVEPIALRIRYGAHESDVRCGMTLQCTPERAVAHDAQRLGGLREAP